MLMTIDAKRILLHCVRASTLLLTIPDKSGKNSDDFVFNRVNIDTNAPSSSADKQVRVTVKRVLHDSDHSTVYLGVIKGQLVVLKCCYNTDYYRDFHVEARVYKRRLEELQGRVVPVCFGYYLAVDEECGPYSLLLLEYCGQSLTTLFEDMKVKERVKILNLLGEFHSKGRLHLTDFAERNVVVRNGKYRLIDFHDFEGHSCDWSTDIDWRVGEFWLEAQKSIPCEILGDLGDEMGIWYDYSKPVVTIHERLFSAAEFPPQNVIDKLMPKDFLGVPQNWTWVDTYFRQVKMEMDKNPNLDLDKLLVTHPPKPPY